MKSFFFLGITLVTKSILKQKWKLTQNIGIKKMHFSLKKKKEKKKKKGITWRTTSSCISTKTYFLKFCLIATPWPCSPHGFLHLRTNWQIIPRGTRLFYSYNLTKCKDPFGGDCLDVIVCYTCMTHSRSLTFIIYFFSTHTPKKKKKVFRKKLLSLSFKYVE